ncbi:hypothetical protein OROGR_023145 [Orobanche gracilis]
MDSILLNLRKYYSSLPMNIIKRIYRARLERLRVLMRNGIPEDIRWLIEAQVRLSGEFSNSLRNSQVLDGLSKESMDHDIHQILDAHPSGYVHRELMALWIQFKDERERYSHQILDAHPSGYVHRELMALWIQFKDERERYSHEKLVSKDPV